MNEQNNYTVGLDVLNVMAGTPEEAEGKVREALRAAGLDTIAIFDTYDTANDGGCGC